MANINIDMAAVDEITNRLADKKITKKQKTNMISKIKKEVFADVLLELRKLGVINEKGASRKAD
jgi:hypothetical protein